MDAEERFIRRLLLASQVLVALGAILLLFIVMQGLDKFDEDRQSLITAAKNRAGTDCRQHTETGN